MVRRKQKESLFRAIIRKVLSDEDSRADWLLISENQDVPTRKGITKVDFLITVREFVTTKTIKMRDSTGKIKFVAKPIFKDALYGLVIDEHEGRVKWIPVS